MTFYEQKHIDALKTVAKRLDTTSLGSQEYDEHLESIKENLMVLGYIAQVLLDGTPIEQKQCEQSLSKYRALRDALYQADTDSKVVAARENLKAMIDDQYGFILKLRNELGDQAAKVELASDQIVSSAEVEYAFDFMDHPMPGSIVIRKWNFNWKTALEGAGLSLPSRSA